MGILPPVRRLTLAALVAAGCDAAAPSDTDEVDTDEVDTDTPIPWVDSDGDGISDGADCDDADAARYPGAGELCDGVDQDCDGEVDEGALADTIRWRDADGDGWGTALEASAACTSPYVEQSGDCDDADGTVFPGAAETCDDRDHDCNGVVDDGCPPETPPTDVYTSDADVVWEGATRVLTVRGQPATSCPGDLDGDGFGDVLFGAVDHTTSEQLVLVVSGGTVTPRYRSLADEPSLSLSYLTAFSGVGDVDGDGLTDLALGDAVYANAAWLVYGSTDRFAGRTLAADAAALALSWNGDSISAAGDLDDDGFADFALGSRWWSDTAVGGVSLVYGGTRDELAVASAEPTWEGLGADGAGGFAAIDGTVTVGDWNADGLDDVALGGVTGTEGSESYSDMVAYVFEGTGSRRAGLSTSADADGVVLADEPSRGGVLRAEDLDGDGVDDLVISDRYDNSSGQDAVWVHVGGSGGLGGTRAPADAFASVIATAWNDGIGIALAAGDLDGDGGAELLVGAEGAQEREQWGLVLVVPGGPGMTGAWDADDVPLRIVGDSDVAGWWVDTADFDGDGLSDVVATSRYLHGWVFLGWPD
jgi:hypothetical protein